MSSSRVITNIALIVIGVTVVIVTFMRPSVPILLLLCSIISIITIYIHTQTSSFEGYEDAEVVGETKNSIMSMLDEYGFPSVNALKDYINGNYNEDLDKIKEDNSLTLYYSVFSTNSAPEEHSRVWRNISPYFIKPPRAVKDSCSITPYDKTHFEFDEVPFVNRNVGLEILSNNITGPLSHQLGIAGNGTFSIFIVIRFNSFSSNNMMDYEVFKVYGNTISNNAISLVIGSQPLAQTTMGPSGPVPTNVYDVNLNVMFGTHVLAVENSTQIDTTKTYMFIITKTSKKLSFIMHDLTSTTPEPGLKLIDAVELSEPSVRLSNKEMSINTNRNLNANIYAFGIYNRYLIDDSTLRSYMYTELFKTSDAFMKMARSMLKMQDQVDKIKACPYNSSSVRDACNITDWSDFNNVINSTPECKSAIDTYCSKNINDTRCRCWDPLVGTSECKSYMNIFRGSSCINVDNLDIDTLTKIKSKYNLCDCSAIDRITEKAEKANKDPPPQLTSPTVPVSDSSDALYYGTPIGINASPKPQEKHAHKNKATWKFWKWF